MTNHGSVRNRSDMSHVLSSIMSLVQFSSCARGLGDQSLLSGKGSRAPLSDLNKKPRPPPCSTLRLRSGPQRVSKGYSVAERLSFPLSIDLVSATSLYNRQAFCLSVEMIFAGFPCEIYSAKARKMKAWGEACRSPSQAALSELNSYLNVS